MSNDRPLYKIIAMAPPQLQIEMHYTSKETAVSDYAKIKEALALNGGEHAIELVDDFGSSMLVRPCDWPMIMMQDFASAFEGHSEFQLAMDRWNIKMQEKAQRQHQQAGKPAIIAPGPGVRLPG